MLYFQSRSLNPSASSQTRWKSAFLFVLVSVLTLATSCSNEGNPVEPFDEPVLKGIISTYNEYDGAMFDFTKADMEEAGFTVGDVISITFDDQTFVVPYYDGYYTRSGEYLTVAYPSYPSICFTASLTGLPEELRGLEGHSVTVRMKEKGGCLGVQKAMSMQYTNDRNDYPNLSDAEYANVRAAKAGHIADGVLYRCSTPFTNLYNRANYVSEYLESVKVGTVLNLADTEEMMQSYDMPSFSRTLWDGGNVILCPLKADPTAEDYNNRLIAALKELPSRPAPYVVHCMEGKDRTGYVCALLEGLCGATYEEIVADYLVTYYNYYSVTPEKDRDACNTLVSLRLNPCLMYYAGISDEAQLPNVDYAKAFSDYLLSHGMNQQQLDALIQALR
jgi:hypothetical protein